MRPVSRLVVLFLALAGPATAQPADAGAVLAAERAWATDALRLGQSAANLRWSAPDAAVVGAREPRDGARTQRSNRVAGASGPAPSSTADWAGIARSGDLGFTTRAVAIDGIHAGHAVTVWHRQPDGQWRWVLQGGLVPTEGPDQPGPPQTLATSILGSSSPDTALHEVAAVEAVLASAALIHQKPVHLALLAPDARLFVAHHRPATNAAQFSAALDDWPERMALEPPQRRGASDAGDMVWTQGRAYWSGGPLPRSGHYVHLWQKRSTGWILIFAQIISDPATPPARG